MRKKKRMAKRNEDPVCDHWLRSIGCVVVRDGYYRLSFQGVQFNVGVKDGDLLLMRKIGNDRKLVVVFGGMPSKMFFEANLLELVNES